MSIQEIILIHVRACGPVSFRSIARYVDEQYPGAVSTEDHVVAGQLTQLIRDGKIELYDDGIAFVGSDS
jgi:hypothetical protein